MGGGSKSESKPRPLEGWEKDTFELLGAYYASLSGLYPAIDVTQELEQTFLRLANNLENIPTELQEIIVPYMTGFDNIQEGLDEIKKYKYGLQPAYQNVNKLLSNTMKTLGGLWNEVAKNPKIYDNRFGYIKDMQLSQYQDWKKYADNTEQHYNTVMNSLPTINIGGISMKPPALGTQAARDRAMQIAQTGQQGALKGLTDIEQGYMDTLAASQKARTDISGNLIPGILGQQTTNLNAMGTNLNDIGTLEQAKANVLASRYNLESMPIQAQMQLASPIANLYQQRADLLLDPLEYIKQIQLARAGQQVKSEESGGGFPLGIGLSIPFSPIKLG